MTDHASRKDEHLDLCATEQVAFTHKGTLLDEVELVHDALPDLALDNVDTSVELCGKRVATPLVIAAMTGGPERAERINRDLASVAEARGMAFGFGSMRPLLTDPHASGYQVRKEAPTALLLGNLGLVQAMEAPLQQLEDLIGHTGCDALCLHLNPAMEVIQKGGDRDFRGGLEAIARIRAELSVPVVVKETGCGLSRQVGERLVQSGIRWVDVSGAGGTSWVGVETLRARARSQKLGERFWNWGIPTAGSVLQLSDLGLGVIATGGVRHGLDVARAIALGATAAGLARPFLSSWNEGGRGAVDQAAQDILEELRLAMLLTASQDVAALQRAPCVLGPRLRAWLPRVAGPSPRR